MFEWLLDKPLNPETGKSGSRGRPIVVDKAAKEGIPMHRPNDGRSVVGHGRKNKHTILSIKED